MNKKIYSVLGVLLVLGAGIFFATIPDTTDASVITVNIYDNYFSPASLTVVQGDTVTWRNYGSMSHTVTGTSGGFMSGTIPPGGTYSYTFTTAGVWWYSCGFHPGMTGSITVTSNASYYAPGSSLPYGNTTYYPYSYYNNYSNAYTNYNYTGYTYPASYTGSSATVTRTCTWSTYGGYQCTDSTTPYGSSNYTYPYTHNYYTAYDYSYPYSTAGSYNYYPYNSGTNYNYGSGINGYWSNGYWYSY